MYSHVYTILTPDMVEPYTIFTQARAGRDLLPGFPRRGYIRISVISESSAMRAAAPSASSAWRRSREATSVRLGVTALQRLAAHTLSDTRDTYKRALGDTMDFENGQIITIDDSEEQEHVNVEDLSEEDYDSDSTVTRLSVHQLQRQDSRR